MSANRESLEATIRAHVHPAGFGFWCTEGEDLPAELAGVLDAEAGTAGRGGAVSDEYRDTLLPRKTLSWLMGWFHDQDAETERNGLLLLGHIAALQARLSEASAEAWKRYAVEKSTFAEGYATGLEAAERILEGP